MSNEDCVEAAIPGVEVYFHSIDERLIRVATVDRIEWKQLIC